MRLLGTKLSDVESRLVKNAEKNRAIFPEEIQQIESGLILLRELTKITKEASKEYPNKPNYYANHDLFARNRQLLTNAYVSLLFSAYGTNFVILRTVLENNNLMRLFNKNPKLAFWWFPQNIQKRFSKEVQTKFSKHLKERQIYKPEFVRKKIFDTVEKETLRVEIRDFYSQLCNYTHPNYVGWKELVVQNEGVELILNVPSFSLKESEVGLGVYLFVMQGTLKGFVETFKDYLLEFASQLYTWQEKTRGLLQRRQETNKS